MFGSSASTSHSSSASPPPSAANSLPYPPYSVHGYSQPIIDLEAGWNTINGDGLKKLQQIIQTGSLQQEQQRAQSASQISWQIQPHKQSNQIGFTNEEYARLYTVIYQMCIQKPPHCFTAQLYERYDQSISEYLATTVFPSIQGQSGSYMIREIVRRWEDHQIMRKWMYDFFRYIDRFYVKRHGKKSLNEVAITRFRALVFEKCKGRLTLALLETIKKDRNGEEVDRETLQKAVQIYVDMGLGSLRVYQNEFEKPFLEASREYYTRESSSWIATDSCPEYLRKCQERFKQEKRRVQEYLIQNTETALMNVLNGTLLMHHQKELLEKENTGVRALLKSHAESDLSRLYSLYAPIPESLPFISAILRQHIIEIGVALLNKMQADQAARSTYIEDLMKIHETYFELVRTCFAGNGTFQKALKEAFDHIINQGRGSEQSSAAGQATTQGDREPSAKFDFSFSFDTFLCVSELLATYADDVLRKGGLQLEEAQVDKTLDSIVRLFSYLIDKDLFAEFYRKQLATRLLTQRSASSDAEKSMIGKLKLLMGAQFTSKLEGMFNDMRNAAEHLSDFQTFLTSRAMNLDGIEFTVQTLTTGFWPSYPMDELKLPRTLQNCLDCFRIYYDTRTNNRKLRWIHDLGVVTLGANFDKRRLDLVVSTVQATILLQFNEFEELSIDQLIQYTGLSADVMKQTLKSLVSGKFQILTKTPSQGYATNHTMRVNRSFQSAQFRVRIPNAIRKTTTKDRETASTTVQEDRKHAMEANIVRIMKARKVMNHMQLMTEVRQHTGVVSQQLMAFFQPDPRAIKQRIEDLIQREYMKRDDDQSNVYHYLA